MTRGPSIAERSMLTVLATAFLFTAGCASINSPGDIGQDALTTWLESRALPQLIEWRAQQAEAVSLVIRSEPIDDPASISTLADELSLATAMGLRANGFPAQIARINDATGYEACDYGSTVDLAVTIGVFPAVGSKASVVLTAISPRSPATLVITSGPISLTAAQSSLAHQSTAVPAVPGSIRSPYKPDEADGLLDELVAKLRCDFLRAKWRAGTPAVSWDVDQPSDWYRSLGLRLRDELVRLDHVVGAPASSVSVSRIELRAEVAGDGDLIRLVVRAASGSASAVDGPAVWHQAYFRAPAPAARPRPATPRVAAANRVAEPPRTAPEPARPVATPAPRFPSLGAARFLVPAHTGVCQEANPWARGAAPVETERSWHTGDCFSIELDAVRADELYLLHRSDSGALRLVFPTRCIGAEIEGVNHWTVRIPEPHPGSRALQLTPPGGRETFLAIALSDRIDPQVRRRIVELNDVCTSRPATLSGRAAEALVDAIHRSAINGQADMQVLTVYHQESFR